MDSLDDRGYVPIGDNEQPKMEGESSSDFESLDSQSVVGSGGEGGEAVSQDQDPLTAPAPAEEKEE